MKQHLRIRTERLELIPATLDMLESELTDRAELMRLLDARIEDWPPPLNDAGSMTWIRDMMRADPEIGGWGMWYFVRTEGRDRGDRTAIGNGGFKGAPDAEGTVEVGYSVLERYQRQGFGFEAVGALVDWAFAQDGVLRVIAETLPELTGSIRLLQKLGFELTGEGSEPGVLRFERLTA